MPNAAHIAINEMNSMGAPNQKPTAIFSTSTNNLTVITTSTSSDPDGTIVSYLWGWGDGGSNLHTNTPSANYTYASAGTYTVALTVTDNDGATDTTTQSVTVTTASAPVNSYTQDTGTGTNGGQQVTGAGYTLFNVNGSDLGVQATNAGANNQLSMPVGTSQSLKGWNGATVIHAADITAGGGIIGAGSARTTVSQVPNSSTGDSYINGTPRDELIRSTVDNAVYQDFELLGTSQSVDIHYGFQVTGANTTFRRLKLTMAGQGSLEKPPAETMAISVYNTTGLTVEDVEIDGNGVGASGFATNGSSSSGNGYIGDYTVTRLYTHDNWYSGGIALWQQAGNAVYDDCTWDQNRCHWNIERCTGSITINRPRIGALKAATTGWYDGTPAAVVGVFAESGNVPFATSDVQAFRFEIHDPRNLDGTPYTGVKITCQFGSSYDNANPANKITNLWGQNNFKAYDASGNDISSTFFTYTGTPAN